MKFDRLLAHAEPGTARAFAVRNRLAIVIFAVWGMVVAGMLGGDAAESLSSGGFDDPDAASAIARQALTDEFGSGTPDVVLLVTAEDGRVDDPALVAKGQELTEELAAEPGVIEAESYWSLGNLPPLRSTDGTHALVFARLSGGEDEILARAGELRETYGAMDDDVASVTVGGLATTFDEVNHVIEEDLVKAELIAFPLTLVLLLIIFGSGVAALLPLGIGAFAIVGTFFALESIASVTEVSIFALNFTTAMGLGLAIDYSLLVVSRFREELAAGHEVTAAVERTVRTAGRTVVFSALTVASALVALLVFEQAFLRSFAYAGVAVVGLAALGATVVLPAVLAMIGHGVNRWKVRDIPHVEEGTSRWGRIAKWVMRRPISVGTASMLFLVLLGVPFFSIELGFPDDRVLPPSAETRQVGDVLREDFDSSESAPITVVAVDIGEPSAQSDAIDTYAARLSDLDGIARVDAFTGIYAGGQRVFPPSQLTQRFGTTDDTYFSAVLDVPPFSTEAEEIVAEVRQLDAPFDVLVGGQSAELVDGKAGVFARLPLALGILAGITFVVLFLTFGSLLVPVKAIVLNLLSLSATFGAMVWIFQEGNLAGLLNFTPTGTITLTMPVLMFCIAFGLSMDYEVFLLSRVKEAYDETGDNEAAVVSGLEHTGRIVTAAAVLIAVVFAAFSTGRVSFMLMFGLGLTLAVLVDAFVVRATLVPAFMRLAGDANWWAPAPLRRLHDRFGFKEHVALEPAADTPERDGPANEAEPDRDVTERPKVGV